VANPTNFVATGGNIGLNPTTFVPLAFTVPCCAYMLKNAGPDTLYMRSDPNDASTEDNMGAGFYEDCVLPTLPDAYPNRFAPGTVLYWVKCTGPLILKQWY
jgi:hypothetical protein